MTYEPRSYQILRTKSINLFSTTQRRHPTKEHRNVRNVNIRGPTRQMVFAHFPGQTDLPFCDHEGPRNEMLVSSDCGSQCRDLFPKAGTTLQMRLGNQLIFPTNTSHIFGSLTWRLQAWDAVVGRRKELRVPAHNRGTTTNDDPTEYKLEATTSFGTWIK